MKKEEAGEKNRKKKKARIRQQLAARVRDVRRGKEWINTRGLIKGGFIGTLQ